MTASSFDFSGVWQCTYWFPSNKQSGVEEPSVYSGAFQKRGNQYVYESQPNDEGSYIFVRMTVNDDLVTGTWWENTSATGEFKGALYSGAFQALINESGGKVEGKWVGIGQDNGKRQIYTGRIEFMRHA